MTKKLNDVLHDKTAKFVLATLAGLAITMAIGLTVIESPKVINVRFDQEYTIESVRKLTDLLTVAPAEDEVVISLTSPGGMVIAMEELTFAMDHSAATVTVVVPSMAASAAATTLCHADKIFLAKNAVIFFHPMQTEDGPLTYASVQNYMDKLFMDKSAEHMNVCVAKGILTQSEANSILYDGKEVILTGGEVMNRVSK